MELYDFVRVFLGKVVGFLGVLDEIVKVPVGLLGFLFSVVNDFPIAQAEGPSLSRPAPELINDPGGWVSLGEIEGRIILAVEGESLHFSRRLCLRTVVRWGGLHFSRRPCLRTVVRWG